MTRRASRPDPSLRCINPRLGAHAMCSDAVPGVGRRRRESRLIAQTIETASESSGGRAGTQLETAVSPSTMMAIREPPPASIEFERGGAQRGASLQHEDRR